MEPNTIEPTPTTPSLNEQPPAPLQPTSAVKSGLAITSMVIGIVAFLTGVTVIGLILGIPALLLGILALKKSNKKPMAIVGIVLGSIAILSSAIITANSLLNQLPAPDYSKAEFKTYSTSAVQFSYPSTWSRHELSGLMEATGVSFTDDNSSGTINSRVVYYTDISKYGGTPPTLEYRKLSAENTRKETDNFKKTFGNFSGCTLVAFGLRNVVAFEQHDLIGSRADFNCLQNTNKKPVYGTGIVANDAVGFVHTYVLFTNSKDSWTKNSVIFEKMIGDLKAGDFCKPNEC